jgi:hypothetical protein
VLANRENALLRRNRAILIKYSSPMSSDLALDGHQSPVWRDCRETAIWKRIYKNFLLKVRYCAGSSLTFSNPSKSPEATQAQVEAINKQITCRYQIRFALRHSRRSLARSSRCGRSSKSPWSTAKAAQIPLEAPCVRSAGSTALQRYFHQALCCCWSPNAICSRSNVRLYLRLRR